MAWIAAALCAVLGKGPVPGALAFGKSSPAVASLPTVVSEVVARDAPEAESSLLASPIRVDIEVAHGPAAHIHGWWWQIESVGPGPRPVIVLLHGCGGMLNRRGQPDPRTLRYAALMLGRGWHVLAVDSFSSRGTRQICTRGRGEPPAVDQTMRRSDVNAAITWLGEQERVDRSRIALVGWSNGGSTVLDYTHQLRQSPALEHESFGGMQASEAGARSGIQRVAPGLRLAAAFYPGCSSRLRQGYEPAVPVLLLLGLSDDWTPALPCLKLASKNVTVYGWEQAYHGFDGDAPLRFRTDIRTGIRAEGVHQGSNPAAGEEARSILLAALERALAPTALDP